MEQHKHKEYSHHDGQFACECGAIRQAPGVWLSDEESQKSSVAAKKQTRKLIGKYGTAVDAYGQRIHAGH